MGISAMQHEVFQTLVQSHSLCIVPGQSKSNLFSFTSKLRQMVTEKTKQPNPKPKKLLTNMEVLFT